MNEITIAKKTIGLNHPPFIVAEMSGNHNQSLDRALKIVESAAKADVHALKIQTYTADTMTLDVEERGFYISDPKSIWKGKTLYKLYQEACTPWEWHKPIFERCKELGIIGFSTPFDETAVDFLESLNVPCYKIASFENTDTTLLKRVATTGKPVIISTGMASIAELDEAVTLLKNEGCHNFILLKCTSSYPSTPESANLLTIPHMRDLFGVQVGLSDHTMGSGVAVASIALGGVMVEKHFTLSRAEGGVDAKFSMEPDELKDLVVETRRAWQGLGKIHYGTSDIEKESKKFCRSLYIIQNMYEGDILTRENLRAIRPGFGLPVKHYEVLLGKKVNQSVKKGTPASWNLIG